MISLFVLTLNFAEIEIGLDIRRVRANVRAGNDHVGLPSNRIMATISPTPTMRRRRAIAFLILSCGMFGKVHSFLPQHRQRSTIKYFETVIANEMKNSKNIAKRRTTTLTGLPPVAILMNDTPVLTTAIAAGGTCLALQLGIQHTVLKGDANGARKAHSKVALLLMLFVSIWGCWGWFGSGAPTSAAARIWGENTSVSKLGAIIAGAMMLWDIPVSLSVKTLRKNTALLLHHVVMAAVAFVGATALPTHYGFFYLGVSELSSIPLVLYEELKERSKVKVIPVKIIDYLKIFTAVSFTLVRVIYFTKITLLQFCPDVWQLLRGGDSTSATVLWFMLTTSLGFTMLQLFWFYSNILSALWAPKAATTE